MSVRDGFRLDGMVWFLHAVEDDEGQWTCRRGLRQLDSRDGKHPDVGGALAHLREVAGTLDGATRMVLHHADGRTEHGGVADLEPGTWQRFGCPVEVSGLEPDDHARAPVT
jgi:hypothetical protein